MHGKLNFNNYPHFSCRKPSGATNAIDFNLIAPSVCQYKRDWIPRTIGPSKQFVRYQRKDFHTSKKKCEKEFVDASLIDYEKVWQDRSMAICIMQCALLSQGQMHLPTLFSHCECSSPLCSSHTFVTALAEIPIHNQTCNPPSPSASQNPHHAYLQVVCLCHLLSDVVCRPSPGLLAGVQPVH